MGIGGVHSGKTLETHLNLHIIRHRRSRGPNNQMSDTDSRMQTGLPTEESTHEDYQDLSSYVEQLRVVDEGLEEKSNTDPLLRSSSRAMVARLVSEIKGTEGNGDAIQALTEVLTPSRIPAPKSKSTQEKGGSKKKISHIETYATKRGYVRKGFR